MRTLTLMFMTLAALAGAADAGEALDAVRDEVVACRTALGSETAIEFQTIKLINAAQDRFTAALEIFDAGDPSEFSKAFALIGAGMKKMEKAAKAEKTEDFDDFVVGWEARIWIVASSVFKAADVIVGGAEVDPALQKKLSKKMARASRLQGKGKLGSAVKKLAGAWKVQAKIDPDP
jgi:hypothetical protein